MSKALTQEEFEERLANYTGDSVIVLSKYINKKTKVKVKCKICGHEWELSPASIMPKPASKHTFSGCPRCKYETVECAWCHTKYLKLKSELARNKSGYVYCSKECGNRHKNALITQLKDGTNYRRNAMLYYSHKCAICGWDEDERVLEVHHLDEDRTNNKIENLRILCPICHKKLTLHLYSYQELINKYRE